jgi:hypothetical protein
MPDRQLTLSYVYKVYKAQVETKKQAVRGSAMKK